MNPKVKNIIIAVCLVAIGILIAQMCRSPRITQTADHTATIDSLVAINAETTRVYQHKADSIEQVVQHKTDMINTMGRTLTAITEKYNRLRSSGPSHDTIVQTVEVYNGAECLEKMPVIQAQLDLCMGQVDDLKHMVVVKNSQIMAVQGQFNRSIQLNKEQQVEVKKLKRRVKWQKVAMVGEAVVGLGLVVYGATR